MLIDDGTGAGYKAHVTDENKLRVYSTVETEISFESEFNGRAFSWSNVSYDYAAGDTVLLVKNTSTTLNLIVDHIHIYAGSISEVVVHCPTCASPTGTAVTGVNMNRQSGRVAESTAIADETTNTQANVIARHVCPGSGNGGIDIELDGALILGLNDCIAIDFTDEGASAYVNIEGYYHEVKD